MSKNSTRVLVIEDNAVDAKLIERILRDNRKQSFEVSIQDRLAEGIESLTREHRDAIVLDLNLPDSGGIETLERVLQFGFHIPVIVLTAQDDDHVAMQALRTGADDYMRKADIGTGLLPRIICHAVERRKVQAELRRTQQVDVLRQITGAAIHDLNNLVSVISGNIDLILDQVDRSDALLGRIERIKRALGRMTALTSTLLAFTSEHSRPRQSPLPMVNLETALANIEKIFDRERSDSRLVAQREHELVSDSGR